MSDGGDIVILTTTFNDWESLHVLLGLLDGALGEKDYTARVVVIDDGSTEIADMETFAALDLKAISKITLVTLTRNMGNETAVAIGMGYLAAEKPCDFLVVMDADLEDRPEDVPQLLAAARNTDGKIIFGRRAGREDSNVFKIFYEIYKRMFRILTGMPFAIGNFCAMPGHLVRRVAGITEIWHHFPAGIMRAKLPYDTMPFRRGKRLHGESKTNFVNLVIYGLGGFAVYADVIGVRIIIGILGLGSVIAVAMVIIFILKITGVFVTLGWPSQIILALGGILFQGLIASVFIIFVLLAVRHQRMVIPAVDYINYVLNVERIFPRTDEKKET